MTCGRETWNSYPSLRIFSIRMDSCSSPRPFTVKASLVLARSMTRLTLVSSSFSSRSHTWRDVTYFPSFPRKGESFIWNVIAIVGSSICMAGRASGLSPPASVSPRSILSNPATGHDVAGIRLADLALFQAAVLEELGDLSLHRLALLLEERNLVPGPERAVVYLPGPDLADVIVVFHRGHQELRIVLHLAARLSPRA